MDVEEEFEVLAEPSDARDAVVFLLVDFGDDEGRVEEERVGAVERELVFIRLARGGKTRWGTHDMVDM